MVHRKKILAIFSARKRAARRTRTKGYRRAGRADPRFRDLDSLDFRLKPTSPCRGKASDGGDIGCRYTPEMLEIRAKALELRKKGIIKF